MCSPWKESSTFILFDKSAKKKVYLPLHRYQWVTESLRVLPQSSVPARELVHGDEVLVELAVATLL
jgi:hypothetical protein